MRLRHSSLALAFALTLTASIFSQQANAQSYNELEPLNESQAQRLEITAGHTRVDQPVVNFGVVEAGLYRSGAPTSFNEMKALAKLGVKTIVDLENSKKKIAQETAWAKSVGIKVISIPLSGIFAPSDRDEARVQKMLGDKTQRPLLFHCAHGQERAGLAAALYRVFSNGWTPQAAYQEMKDYGFHSITFPMKEYFEKATKTDL
jgi:protein tyrosine/serine phosphatase